MSVIKTAFIFLVLISMAIGGIYVKKNVQQGIATRQMANIAPIIIGKGFVRFPQRVPSPDTVFQIQTAVQTDDAAALNSLLIKHRFYVLPSGALK